MYGFELNVASTPSDAFEALLGLSKSWFSVEGPAWNLVRDLISSRWREISKFMHSCAAYISCCLTSMRAINYYNNEKLYYLTYFFGNRT